MEGLTGFSNMDWAALRVIRDQLKIFHDMQAEHMARPPPGPNATPRERVKHRLAPTLLQNAQAQYLERVQPSSAFKSAPLQNPPIPTGMVDSIKKLKAIVVRQGSIEEDEYKQVPTLLKRIRYLLRVYYDAKVTRRRPAEFKYCDVEDLASVGTDLRECGLTLQFMPGRLRALFRSTPEMDEFLLDEPLDIGKWRREAFALEEAVAVDAEADDTDRMTLADLQERNRNDLAAYQMVYLVGDLLVAWVLIKPLTDLERRRAERAMERLIEYSSAPQYRKGQVLGDPLTDAMRPIYEDQGLMLRFARAGGLPAIFEDWAVSYAKDQYVNSALEALPKSAWADQTVESLVGVMQGILHKIEYEDQTVIKNPIVVRAIHEMYTRYGLEPFERGAKISQVDQDILFYFLYRRISRKPDAYKTYKGMQALLRKSLNVVETTRRRCKWIILSISDRWNCLNDYGCALQDDCPEYNELLKLKSQRKRGFRNPEVEQRLYRWGAESKACTSCREVSYCSAACQKADWKDHKPQCQKKSARDKTQMEVDI